MKHAIEIRESSSAQETMISKPKIENFSRNERKEQQDLEQKEAHQQQAAHNEPFQSPASNRSSHFHGSIVMFPRPQVCPAFDAA
ncbi:hypothetical protein [Enterobacter hormaechei]|uniref:hypothetical protein n=1 Tax=Enterobacter hormaechei TaxID=158836 RepID=UPI002E170965|nr:hypothetical protein [Enterobacter hormaechei]